MTVIPAAVARGGTRADQVDAEVRAQVERAMADPERVMPSERAALERMGFCAAGQRQGYTAIEEPAPWP